MKQGEKMQTTPNEIANDIQGMFENRPIPTESITHRDTNQAKPVSQSETIPEHRDTNQSKSVSQSEKLPKKMEPTPFKTCKKGYTFDSRIHQKDGKTGGPRMQGEWLFPKKGCEAGMLAVDAEIELDQSSNIPENEPIIEPEIELEPLDLSGIEIEENPDFIEEKTEPEEKRKPLTESAKAMAHDLAELITDLWIGTGYGLFGKEWLPVDIYPNRNEKDQLEEVWADYLQDSGKIEEIPKSSVVFLSHMAYTSRRLSMGGVFTKMINKFGRWVKFKVLRIEEVQEPVIEV